MGIASEMKQLTNDINSSRRERDKRLSKIKKASLQVRGEARQLLDELRTARRQAGLRLNKDLARHETRRKSEARGILKEAREIVSAFGTSRQESSMQLRKDLANSVAARKAQMGETSQNARKLTQALRDSRKKSGPKLRQELSQSQSSLKSEVDELLSDARDIITKFQKDARATGATVRKKLDKSRAAREAAVKKMRNEFKTRQTAARADIDESRDAWQKLNNNTSAKKSRKIRTSSETTGETAAGENESPGLGVKFLETISQHPQGMTLTEVADNLSVASVVLGRVTKKLLDEGKIRKEDRTYFPVIGE